MRRVDFSPRARRELQNIWTYIAHRTLSAADRLVERIENDATRLAEMPGMGHRRNDVTQRRYRFWRVKPYMIVYRYNDSTLTVLRIIDGARDFRRVFGRKKT